jgi:hypothetical protein
VAHLDGNRVASAELLSDGRVARVSGLSASESAVDAWLTDAARVAALDVGCSAIALGDGSEQPIGRPYHWPPS